MITKDKLNIYKKYSGDIDAWARVGKRKELSIINDQEWSQIDTLINDLELIEKGHASDSFKHQTNKKLEEFCENEEIQKNLKSLIGKY